MSDLHVELMSHLVLCLSMLQGGQGWGRGVLTSHFLHKCTPFTSFTSSPLTGFSVLSLLPFFSIITPNSHQLGNSTSHLLFPCLPYCSCPPPPQPPIPRSSPSYPPALIKDQMQTKGESLKSVFFKLIKTQTSV